MNIISNKGIFQMENSKFSPKQEAENFWLIMISIVNFG